MIQKLSITIAILPALATVLEAREIARMRKLIDTLRQEANVTQSAFYAAIPMAQLSDNWPPTPPRKPERKKI